MQGLGQKKADFKVGASAYKLCWSGSQLGYKFAIFVNLVKRASIGDGEANHERIGLFRLQAIQMQLC
jgi:hypothetical protein